jgi:hypothetical protein
MGKNKGSYQTIPNDSYRFKIWSFIHPDGEFMFYHTERKMRSLLNKDLVKIINQNDRIVQFTITPRGKGVEKGDVFMNTPKEKKCVVCGTSKELTRHHVVPKCFRSHFPEKFKNSNAHDILFICVNHHVKYERVADILKKDYFERYEIESIVPLQTKIISQIKIRLSLAYHLENMLYEGNVCWTKLDYKLRNLLNLEQTIPLSLNQIEYIKNVYEEKMKYARDYFKNENSSKFLVDKILKEDSLESFVKTWRQHFIDNANPKYLPLGWSVERRIWEKENL